MSSNGKTQGSIFEYAVLYHPKPKKVGDDTVTDPSEIVVDVKRVVAQSDNEVAIKAAREIPETFTTASGETVKLLDKLEQVEIAIRPF